MAATTNKGGFWSVILISCIPMILGSVISVSISKSTMVNEMSTKCAVMDEKINGNKELVLNLLSESEKRRTEQYQYLCKETDEIKEQLKQKKNISMMMNIGDSINISPDMEYMVKRGGYRSRWMDSLFKYTEISDSLYTAICQNLTEINKRLD